MVGDVTREVKLSELEALSDRLAELEQKLLEAHTRIEVLEDAVTAPPLAVPAPAAPEVTR